MQDVFRFLSMLSVQQQNNYNPIQQDYSSVNSQQGLADKIQGVRHLWATENSSVIDSMQQSTQNFSYR